MPEFAEDLSNEFNFNLAGAQLDWPIGSGAGLTNHPDIEAVGRRLNHIVRTGVSFSMLGSWTLGERRLGNGFEEDEETSCINEVEGDEFVDYEERAGYNAKALGGPGTDVGMKALADLVGIGRENNVEVGVSFSPHRGNPIEELKEITGLAKEALKHVLFVEINLSCPNLEGRPAFYLDEALLQEYFDFLAERPLILNKHGVPGIFFKYGPYDTSGQLNIVDSLGYGRTTSNTLGLQTPPEPKDSQAKFTANNGKGGKSGPALKMLGREQLHLHIESITQSDHQGAEVISVLGVDSGEEVYKRVFGLGANAVQLVSPLYWPQLVGKDHPAQVVEEFKAGLVDAIQRR